MDTLVTYSILSLINEKQSNLNSFIDIFKELCESILFNMKTDSSGKGLITDLKQEFESRFAIKIPYPTLKIILKRIRQEQKQEFELYADFSFTYTSDNFNKFNFNIESEVEIITELKDLYSKLCKDSNIENKMGIEFFIDVNRKEILHYLNNEEFIMDGNTEFPIFQTIYSLEKYKKIIDRLILGSVISTYIELDIIGNISTKTLLLDTNFIISLLDLHSIESKLNCDEIVSIAKKYKYELLVLPETLQEVRNLLERKAESISKLNLFVSQDFNTIEHGCFRRNLRGSDLQLISKKLEHMLLRDSIRIISRAENRRLYEKAPKSDIYEKLQDRPFNRDGIIHDAMAQLYIREIRGEDETGFADTSAFFVTDTHGYFENKITSKAQLPYIIRAEELLNILWLLNPTNNSMISRANISRVFSLYLNRRLPGRELLKKVDRRIQGIQTIPINIQDCVNIAVNLSVLDNKDLEDLYSLEEDSALKDKIIELSLEATRKKDQEIQKELDNVNKAISFFEEKNQKEILEKENTQQILKEKEKELREKTSEISLQELRLNYRNVSTLKLRDEEELETIDKRIESLESQKDQKRWRIKYIIAGLIFIPNIIIGILVVIPYWDIVEPISFIFNIMFPIIYIIWGKKINSLHFNQILESVTNLFSKSINKQISDDKERQNLLRKRITDYDLRLKQIVI